MNKRMTKVFSFAAIALLMLGEGASFAYAVTEETTTTSTSANEKVLKTQETETSSERALTSSTEETVTSSSEEVVEETTSSSETATESSTEASEEKESKKEKSKAPKAGTVTFADNNLYQVVRENLNLPSYNQGIADGTPITIAQMEMLTRISRTSTYNYDNVPISDLDGIQYATNLEEFVLDGKYVEDTFTSLPAGFSDLKKLKILRFSWGVLKDIDELKDHPALTVFSAVQNDLDSLEGLSGCTELEEININGSANSGYAQNGNIQNFKGLEKSTKLKKISFDKYNEDKSATEVGKTEPSYVGKGLQSLEGLNCADSLETLILNGHPGLHTLDGLENYTQLKSLSVVGDTNYSGRGQYYTNPGGVNEIYFDPAIHTPTFITRGLRGAGSIDALSSCTSLETVNLMRNAIEEIDPLAGKTSLKKLNIGDNLVETLAPLKTTTNLVELYAAHNLLPNLEGLQPLDSLQFLDVSAQNSGAVNMPLASGQQNIRCYLRGLLEDITALNSKSLKEISISDNRLEDLSSLKNASNLVKIQGSNNPLADTKGDLDGCTSLSFVNFSNCRYVNFSDIGLADAKNSLKELYLSGQGLRSDTAGNMTTNNTLLENLDGLKNFTILEKLNLDSNSIDDNEMKHIPVSIIELDVSYNNLQNKAFSTFTPADFTRLVNIYADYNHISDIKPLEALSSGLKKVFLRSQSISVPKHGGTSTVISTPNNGYEVDVLKTDFSSGLTFTKDGNWGTATANVKSPNILLLDDPNYERHNKNTIAKFSYTGNSKITDFIFDGRINFDVDYGITATAAIEIIPTDFNGNKITEIPQGGIIYWRAKAKGNETQYLFKPKFGYHLQYTQHQLLDPYVDVTDPEATEYVNGARVEMGGLHIPTPSGLWGDADLFHNRINKDNMVDITVVTKVNDDATVGEEVNMYLYFEGLNFDRADDTKTVKVKAKVPEVINLSAPDRFDFGKGNEATKTAKIYKPDAKAYSAKEQTDGFNVRVTDTRQGASRTDWKVVGQLSDLTNSKSTALKAGSVAPTLALRNISLFNVDTTGGTDTEINPGATGRPSWDQDILLTAGGASVQLSKAASADGEGVWDYRIPFDNVELNVPSNVNDQAGYTFNGKLTWTLDDTL